MSLTVYSADHCRGSSDVRTIQYKRNTREPQLVYTEVSNCLDKTAQQYDYKSKILHTSSSRVEKRIAEDRNGPKHETEADEETPSSLPV